jgi:hypothetical protein
MRHREGFSRSGHTQEHLPTVTSVKTSRQLADRPRLVTA